MGVVTTPLTVYLQPHKNAKESDPGHLEHLFYILCGHFDEKNRHFEKYQHGIVLKLSGHVRKTPLPFFI